jgi:4-hydroxy-3-methylbut-2-enyl diphosphate reductase
MKINVLQPYGWCAGVAKAFNQINQIVKKHHGQNIYLIGWLVHNKSLMQQIQQCHIKILDDTKQTKLAALKTIKERQAVIILPTHGTPQDALAYAQHHFKYVYDLTCPYLQNNFDLFKKIIKQNDVLIYFGKKHHPESKVVSSFHNNVIIVENKDEVSQMIVNPQKHYVLVNQSTIPQLMIKDVCVLLTKRIKHLKYINTTCQATNIRHNNIDNLKGVDLLLVIGDKRSNNVNQLIVLAQNKSIKTKLISTDKDIKANLFKNIKHLAITSGTSVDPQMVTTIVKKIKTIVQ